MRRRIAFPNRSLAALPARPPLGAALLGAWAAARISARRTARIRPAEALAEAAVERRTIGWGRLGAGVALLAGGIVLLAVLAALRTEPASTPVHSDGGSTGMNRGHGEKGSGDYR
ncbi:hypothetical protein ACWCQ0_47335 [Streptomyces massasporeus]